MSLVDLRSDTVTRPTPAMRQAMAQAEVGDDVFGDDPTVNLLQERVAAFFGKEAALYVPSGTMANQLAVSVLTRPGTQLILDEGAHILNYEGGAPAALWGVQLHPLTSENGKPKPGAVRAAIRPKNEHFAPAVALALENTHNRAGGSYWRMDEITAITQEARKLDLKLHLDGARLWNALAASKLDPKTVAAPFDTVSVCFSKGMGAPVGSVLVGSSALIEKARFTRKRLGGGMRQAGILAAAALHALEHHRERLVEDHARATALAHVLGSFPGVEVLPVETNIVIADLSGRKETQIDMVETLKEHGVWVVGFGENRFRCVTHLDVDDAGIEFATTVFRKVLGAGV